MDQCALSSKSVLETLLKTNRPPTDQEKAIIQESMAPTNAKLKVVQTEISDTVAHIQALKSQVEQTETKLQRLREEEAAILETFADQRRVFSPFRNLPEDVLREICVACVEVDMPKLAYHGPGHSLPYILAQICGGMRHIALTTPLIWASMDIEFLPSFSSDIRENERTYSTLARRASTWFERAGGLALTISIRDSNAAYDIFESTGSNPLGIFFDTLLSYSTRWKNIQFHSRSNHIEGLSILMMRIAALTAVDVPLLQSISLRIDGLLRNAGLRDSVLLTLPTLKHVHLETTESLQMFAINWSILTSFTLRGSSHFDRCHSKSEIARALQQTKCLVFCNISVGFRRFDDHYANEITLPFLKTLIVGESTPEAASSAPPNILDLINAPILEIFDIRGTFLNFSLSDFFKRSPHIKELSLPCRKQCQPLVGTAKLLRHCPSLAVLSLWPCEWFRGPHDANQFLREFVKEGNTGVICPRLQHFTFTGNINFSLETLRLFLEGRQRDISTLKVLPWKSVVFDTIRDSVLTPETRQPILDLVSQKQATGLHVEIKEPLYQYRPIFPLNSVS